MTKAFQEAVLFLLNDTARRGDGPASFAAHKRLEAIAAEQAADAKAESVSEPVKIEAANAETLLSTLEKAGAAELKNGVGIVVNSFEAAGVLLSDLLAKPTQTVSFVDPLMVHEEPAAEVTPES